MGAPQPDTSHSPPGPPIRAGPSADHLKIFASHALLQALTAILAAIPYNDNDVWLHTDESLMPVEKKTWASWNFLGRSRDCSGE